LDRRLPGLDETFRAVPGIRVQKALEAGLKGLIYFKLRYGPWMRGEPGWKAGKAANRLCHDGERLVRNVAVLGQRTEFLATAGVKIVTEVMEE
jgi:hypothetical protein